MRQSAWHSSVVRTICMVIMVLIVSPGAHASILDEAAAAWQFDGMEAINGDPLLRFTHNEGNFLPHQTSVLVSATNSDGWVGKDDPAGNGTNGFAAVHPVMANMGHPLDITGSLTMFGRIRYGQFTERDDVWRFGGQNSQVSRVYALEVNNGNARFIVSGQGSEGETYVSHDATLKVSTWYDIVGVFDAAAKTIAISVYDPQTGDPVGSTQNVSVPFDSLNNGLDGGALNMLALEEPSNGTGINIGGEIDVAAVWDRTLSADEIASLSLGAEMARFPSPADNGEDVLYDAILGWTPSLSAATHDVYLGTGLDDVMNASRANPRGVLVSQGQDANTYDPAGLQFGQTYYWRVDEIDGTPDSPIVPGVVWQFTVESYSVPVTNIKATASSSSSTKTGPEKTVDRSGMDPNGGHSTDANAMWLSSPTGPQPTWIQYEFDRTYKLHQMLIWNSNQTIEAGFGLGAKAVAIETSLDGDSWTAWGEVEFAQAPGSDGYGPNPPIDLGGVVTKYVRLTMQSGWGGVVPQYGLSEVRFDCVPVWAREPEPVSGTTVDPSVMLSWRAGREATSHEIYLGTDPNDLALVATVAESRFDAAPYLQLGQTYYWSVVEVNEIATPSSWASDVWSFSIPESLTVDDFETYADREGTGRQWIWEVWADGYEDPANGSVVGHINLPELVTVYDGMQSMPISYDNTSVLVSEATRTLTPAQDWTRGQVKTLVLYFHGDQANAGSGQLYFKINGKQVLYAEGNAALTKPSWTQWTVNLESLGADLEAVTSLAVGVKGSGAAGILYVDAIGLYTSAPSVPTERVWFVNDTNPQISYSEGWTLWNGAAPAGGSLHYANRQDCTVELTFYGTGVTLIHKAGADCGIVEASIDGAPVAISPIDTYSPVDEWNRRTSVAANLTQGKHTLTLKTTGLKNEKATNSYAQICGIELRAAVDQP